MPIMKTKRVYVVHSTKEESYLIFGTRKRAEEWIDKKLNKEIFTESEKENLYISSRVVF